MSKGARPPAAHTRPKEDVARDLTSHPFEVLDPQGPTEAARWERAGLGRVRAQ